MLPLAGRDFPTNRQQLADALRGGLALVLRLPPGRTIVDIGEGYPAVDRLILDVTAAIPRDDFRPAKLTGLKQPALSVTRFEVFGLPLGHDQAAITLKAAVSDARFEFHRDQQGQNFLTLVDGRDGHFFIRGKSADFHALFLPMTRALAAEQGITIKTLEWTLAGQSDRQLTFAARVQASKKLGLMRMSATVRCRGQLFIDDQLTVHLSGLACEGEGMLSTMLVGLVQGQLKRLEQTPMPLTSLSLGRLKVRSLRVNADEWLEAEATLGS